MASATMNHYTSNGVERASESLHDPFTDVGIAAQHPQPHRYSSYLDPDSFSLEAAASPSQAKRTLQAHLSETERRLQDTHKLGTTLLQQRTELAEKLQEVEQQHDDAELPPELKQRLVELEREHNNVGKELARAMLASRSRVVSAEDKVTDSPAAFASQATGSPSKVSVPNRKQRNQAGSRAGDIQFAADISTSLLAEVRQLQALLAERDEALKTANAQISQHEHEAAGFSQRLRTLNESEQRYKDENWNLETQKHELLAASKEGADREKRLNATLAVALAEKSRAQNELDDVKVAHGRLTDDHVAAKKAHDAELHTLKRTVDVSENDRLALQKKIEELTSQNHEFALAVAGRSRHQPLETEPNFGDPGDEISRDISTPEHSPPPSPTKGTPRHGGLESETLKSSLHHAHRMIQNLKGNIHREKTEKIELKRMLQDARDELEQRRVDGGLGSGSKRQKTRSDIFKKPPRPDMLGGIRRPRTDVEIQDEDWEDRSLDSPSAPGAYPISRNVTDVSDAYQTGNETEGAFETADERHATESEAFETGAESLAGDSTDELTETEDTMGRTGTVRGARSSFPLKQVGNRSSYLSTASTSAGEEEDNLQTPMQAQPSKFRLKNGKQSLSRQSREPIESSLSTSSPQAFAQDSPATTAIERSPPGAEQSLFAELGGLDDASSDRYNSPGRSSVASAISTPGAAFDRTRRSTRDITAIPSARTVTVDSGTMTDDWLPTSSHERSFGEVAAAAAVGGAAGYAVHGHGHAQASPSQFPVPPSLTSSPKRNADSATQYTPGKSSQESPMRNIPSFITPPKTVWDEAQDGEGREKSGNMTRTQNLKQDSLGYSGMLSQDSRPRDAVSSAMPAVNAPVLAYSSIQTLETIPVEVSSSFYADSPTLAASDPYTLNSKLPKPQASTAVAAGAGILASAAATLGLSKARDASGPKILEDHTSQNYNSQVNDDEAEKMPLKDVSGNSGGRRGIASDQGSQTLLTAEHIEQALQKRAEAQSAVPATVSTTTRPASQAKDRTQVGEAAPLMGSTTPSKRPGSSSSSYRAPSFSSHHPPLPVDHRTAIAKASGRVSSPANDPNNSSHVSTLMGPPIAPASAYRRSRTPTGQSVAMSPSRDGTTPRYSQRQRTTTGSQMSRRSSVSSFASELDERFNIRTDQPSGSHQFEATPGTDPRMIQAITQTMIGEFLWKYTRKAGRTDMSTTRHRRYFWVHPYTKTLYWSDQDPQTAGRNQMKAKSVAIHSVRVVSDDNPLPPGLHRKSLEVITPGRKIKFTAQTAQRHETWFNALSYLLLRGDDPTNHGSYATGGNEITNEDINEFNAGYSRPTLTSSHSRMSMSSYNSRTTRGTSAVRAESRSSLRQGLPSGYRTSTVVGKAPENASLASRATARPASQDVNQVPTHQGMGDSTVRGTSSSRLSRMMSSMTGRTRNTDAAEGMTRAQSQTRNGGRGSIYNASIVSAETHDSAEDLRRELLKQEREADRLENVRACCDGKHDVSTLAGGGKHTHHTSHSHRNPNLDRLSRSVSRRPVGTIAGPSAGTSGQGVVQMGSA